MASARHGRPGLREAAVVWGLFLFVATEIFATYSRLPVRELYHVSSNGRAGAAGRALVFLNWPVALVALPVLAVVAANAPRGVRIVAGVAAVLCAAIFWPGVVNQADLDAKWSNGFAAVGSLLAFALTLRAVRRNGLGPRRRVSGDRLRWAIAILLLLASLPWLAADLGFLIGRWPLFGSVYYSDEWYAAFGHARAHRAVHYGNHHGLVGVLLVLAVLLLSRTLAELPRRLRRIVGVYLSLIAMYGLAAFLNDVWLEQLVKRGTLHWEFPSLLTPSLSVKWALLLLATGMLYALVLRRASGGSAVAGSVPLWPFAVAPAMAALVGVGLAHGGSSRRTRLGSADGIAFAAAPEGTWHIFVTHGVRNVQITGGDGSDLAPAWSPDRRRLAFQSNRDGNWEIYVVNADGSALRRLTNNDVTDGEPAWRGDGSLTWVHDGRITTTGAAGEWPTPLRNTIAFDVSSGEHNHRIVVATPRRSLAEDGDVDQQRPVWSPDGRLLAFQCRQDDHWRVCVISRRGRLRRVLTGGSADAFAPAWSPDGRRIAFVGDRDGVDQLLVMRADGTGVRRLTNGHGEKDTPAWN